MHLSIDIEVTMPHTAQSDIAQTVLYELWFSVAESIFDRVCEVTELTEEQREALRTIALRPNDFQVLLE
jgi:hypothetical protein